MLPETTDWRYWAMFCGAAIVAGTRRAKNEPLLEWAAKMVGGALLGLGGGRDLAAVTGASEGLASMAILIFGVGILNTITGIVTDPRFINDFLRARAGMPPENDDEK